jgi:hypothetical protein
MPFQQKPATLRPLPTRVTQRQYDRLMQHRARDHLSIQEHVRRSLDYYLEMLDKRWEREMMLSGKANDVVKEPQPVAKKLAVPKVPAVKTTEKTPKSAPKLVFR